MLWSLNPEQADNNVSKVCDSTIKKTNFLTAKKPKSYYRTINILRSRLHKIKNYLGNAWHVLEHSRQFLEPNHKNLTRRCNSFNDERVSGVAYAHFSCFHTSLALRNLEQEETNLCTTLSSIVQSRDAIASAKN